jgi:nitric oxide reductase NorQ protein
MRRADPDEEKTMTMTMTMIDAANGAQQAPMSSVFYRQTSDEVEVFQCALERQLAVMLTGPTGCGKTRLVEHIADRLGRPLFTVSCHEDITAADLIGKFVLRGDSTEWVDGPLTRAVREGGICYLDEIVEARQDTTVAIHSLTDHRRELFIERLGGLRLKAQPGFGLVVSYNPGYQSVLKDLKMSTRQRMVSIELDYPAQEAERDIVAAESGVASEIADRLVTLARAIRRVEDAGLREAPSTRLLIAAAELIVGGLSARRAAVAAIVGPLTDDPNLRDGLMPMVEAYLPATAGASANR